MSNRPNRRARRAQARQATRTALAVTRIVHGCECVDVDERRHDRSVTLHHDPGCPAIGRTQYVIIPKRAGR